MNGFTVKIKFSGKSRYCGKEQVLYNITEIHAGYPSMHGDRIAFESDIDRTGYTYDMADIKEYEAIMQNATASNPSHPPTP